MRILVCIPFYHNFEALKPLLSELKACGIHEFIIKPGQGADIGTLRNRLINDGKSSKKFQIPLKGIDRVLTIDTDVIPTFADIMSMTEHDKDIVCLPYLRHGSDLEYACGYFDGNGNIGGRYTALGEGFRKIPWTGAGAMMIKSHVFVATEFPWYRHPMIEVGDDQDELSEAIGFCVNVKAAGFDIWCDFNRPVVHLPRPKVSWEIPELETAEKV